jgi:hypothetical protein
MSTLRHKKKDPVVSAEDIEALISPDDEAASPRASPANQSKSSISQHDPVTVAKLVLNKVRELISKEENEGDDIATSEGFISLLKDIFIGITFGILCISILIMLDHKDVIHLQSAHNYRNMAYTLLNDPETRASVQESSGLIFMRMEEYDKKAKEIEAVPAQVKELEEKKKKSDANLEVATKERDDIKPGYDKLVSDPMLGLDTFCGDCAWNGGTNCNARKDYLMSTYNQKEIKTKLDMIKGTPQCVKKA